MIVGRVPPAHRDDGATRRDRHLTDLPAVGRRPLGDLYVEEPGGIEVEYEGMKAFIRRSDLSRDRQDQRPDRFSVGDRVDARITNIDKSQRRLGMSIKALQIAEEKEAVEQYGSSDSGASLGDILGAALKEREGGD